MGNNDSGISRGYTVSYRVERQNQHRELTAMSGIAGGADRSGPHAGSCNRLDIFLLADPLGQRAIRRRSGSGLQRSH
jgi:hypothetical protein